MRFRGWILAALVVAAASPARAEGSVESFLRLVNSSDPVLKASARYYVSGTLNGITWTHTWTSRYNAARVVCMPGKLALKIDDIIALLRSQAARDSKIAKAPLGLGMILALRNVYPCA